MTLLGLKNREGEFAGFLIIDKLYKINYLIFPDKKGKIKILLEI